MSHHVWLGLVRLGLIAAKELGLNSPSTPNPSSMNSSDTGNPKKTRNHATIPCGACNGEMTRMSSKKQTNQYVCKGCGKIAEFGGDIE